ncbi:MAG TPA: hypothetical protein DCQ47_02065 [Gammaproteobacteria bacterium]|nr:hypothetical protein [Gammaproteobacteria bacterium]
MNQLKILCSFVLGLMMLSISRGHASEQTAASIDWVVDASDRYLCRGYYKPPLIENSSENNFNATADNTAYDGADRIILTGNTLITGNNFQLQADRLSFLNSTGDGNANRNVRIRRPNSLFIGDAASVNLRTNTFDLKNSSFVTHKNGLRGESEQLIGAPNGDFRIINGIISFCAPNVNTWDLQAEHVYLNQSSGRGWADDVVIRFKETPVLYAPLLGFPLDNRRLTGFLVPNFSIGSTSGTSIVTPFYWNPADNYDLLIRPRVTTARGPALGLHGRYLFRDFSLLELKTEQLPGDKLTGADRHISKLTFSSDTSKALTWNVAYEDASDRTYQDDLDNFVNLSDKQQLTSSIGATLRNHSWSTGWIFDRVDVIDPTISGSSVKFARQPQLIASWAHYGDVWNVFAKGDATEFTRNTTGLLDTDPSEGRRLSSDVRAEYPISAEFGSLTPAALGFARWSEATTGLTSQDSGYFTYGASLEGNLFFEKSSGNGFVHEIIPMAKMIIREPDKKPTVIKFDTPDAANDTVTVSQMFLDNPISGGDFVGDTRALALAFTSRGVDLDGVEAYRITAGRTFFLQDRVVTLSGATETTNHGPLVLESTIRATRSLDWNIRFKSVTDGETMDRATNELKYRASDTDYLTQRTVWKDEALNRSDLYFSRQISRKWRLLTGVQWASNTEERINQVVGAEYTSCCWRAAMIHAYERDRVTSADGGHYVKLQFELKGLGVLGRGVTSIMDSLLEGYDFSEARF